jgi:hypothetical protein
MVSSSREKIRLRRSSTLRFALPSAMVKYWLLSNVARV